MIRRRSLARLDITPEMAARIREVEAALAVHAPGSHSASDIELPKLALANAVLAQVQRQSKLPTKARAAKAGLPVSRRTRRRA